MAASKNAPSPRLRGLPAPAAPQGSRPSEFRGAAAGGSPHCQTTANSPTYVCVCIYIYIFMCGCLNSLYVAMDTANLGGPHRFTHVFTFGCSRASLLRMLNYGSGRQGAELVKGSLQQHSTFVRVATGDENRPQQLSLICGKDGKERALHTHFHASEAELSELLLSERVSEPCSRCLFCGALPSSLCALCNLF